MTEDQLTVLAEACFRRLDLEEQSSSRPTGVADIASKNRHEREEDED